MSIFREYVRLLNRVATRQGTTAVDISGNIVPDVSLSRAELSERLDSRETSCVQIIAGLLFWLKTLGNFFAIVKDGALRVRRRTTSHSSFPNVFHIVDSSKVPLKVFLKLNNSSRVYLHADVQNKIFLIQTAN